MKETSRILRNIEDIKMYDFTLDKQQYTGKLMLGFRKLMFLTGLVLFTLTTYAIIILSSNLVRMSFEERSMEPVQKTEVLLTRKEKVHLPAAGVYEIPGRCMPIISTASLNFYSTGWYFQPRTEHLNDFNNNFFERSNQICTENENPFLVIVALTVNDHFESRKAIRKTWASVARTRKWPGISENIYGIKLFFIYGVNEGNTLSDDVKRMMDEEIREYGDIVTARFIDSYRNLTIKMITALRWVRSYCPGAKYVVKVDEDVFLHVPNLIRYLKAFGNPLAGQIHGTALTVTIVRRTGRWGVSKDVYPFYRYPIYASGTSYVISGNIVDKLINTAEHMPFVQNEDAFVTGILRFTIGAQLCHYDGFTFWADTAPEPCSFQNDVRIAGTKTTDEQKLQLWSSLHTPREDCYKLPHRYLPDVQMEKWLKV